MQHDGQGTGEDAADTPVTLVLQSRTERLSVLNSLRLGLAGALIVTILLLHDPELLRRAHRDTSAGRGHRRDG